jgi:hypothetical protein
MSAITPSTVARTSGVLPRFTLLWAGSFNITESPDELIAVVTVIGMYLPSSFMGDHWGDRNQAADSAA